MTTARSIITKAMLKAGILTKSEAPSADEASDALDALNAMLASWSNNELNIYVRAWENFPLAGGVGEYTIGAGQTFNTTRPLYLVEAHYRNGDIDYPLQIIKDETYNSIAFKNIQSLPDSINYDNGYPIGKLRLYPIPSASYTLFLLSEKQIATFALDDDIDLPPGWERALIYNLAIELVPEYGVEIPQTVIGIADTSLKAIQGQVERNRTYDWTTDLSTSKNIYTGFFNT